ncbi:MAG: hypothetical protein E6536_10885 [Enterococcus faecalis]|nr:hypothetical protein [Enterococcus faecalis]
MIFDFWRPSRYCSSSNHYVLRDSQQFRLISEGPSTLIQSDFCPTLLFLREIIKKGRFLFSFTL